MSKAILIFDSYETLKRHYGEEVLVYINIPVKSEDGKIKGYQYHSTENAVLKPMPEKTHKNGGCRVIDGKEWWYDSEHDDGWNECIDEILGGEEK